MNLHDLVSNLLVDTRDVSLPRFLPELTLSVTIIVMLLLRIVGTGRLISSWVVALAGSIAALILASPWESWQAPRVELFTGMLVYDGYTIFLRTILLLFVILFILFTRLSGIPDREDGADILTLVLGATVGMCLMASANHLLMVFLGVEMASVPSYALAATMKGRRTSSEAALKYAVYGAGAAGVMLYGISLVGGLVNTLHLPTIAAELAVQLPAMDASQVSILALGGLMIGVGLAFKLSAVPFHFWCPDVFEGAPAEVNAFLSVASKAAALGLLLRVAVGFGTVPHADPVGGPAAPAVAAVERDSSLFNVPADEAQAAPSAATPATGSEEKPAAAAPETAPETAPESKPEAANEEAKTEPADASAPAAAAPAASTNPQAALSGVRDFIAKFVAFLAVITCTFGNLAAYGQTNIKRMFAYSTIAHAGYMMMPIPALMAVAGFDPDAARRAAAGMAVYIFCYLFMNLGVFVVIAFLRNAMRSEEISDYAGLIRRCPLVVVCFALILFSLVGLPPLSGFIGKLAVFASLAEAYQITAARGVPGVYLLVLLLVGSVNTAISLFYYLRVVKVMTIDPEKADRRPLEFSNPFLQGLYLGLITLPTAALILSWEWLYAWSLAAADQLLG